MNKKVKLTNWELGLLKLVSGLLGIAIGAYFADFIKPYVLEIAVMGIGTGILFTFIWLRAMRQP